MEYTCDECYAMRQPHICICMNCGKKTMVSVVKEFQNEIIAPEKLFSKTVKENDYSKNRKQKEKSLFTSIW